MEQLIAGLSAILGRVQPEAGINDIADWAWLAAIVKGEASPEDTARADHGHDALAQGAVPPLRDTEVEPPLSSDPEQTTSEPAPSEAAELRTSGAGRAPATEQRGVPFSTPGGRALPQPLEIARALRPLIRRLPAHDLPPLLDEETSIRRILDSDLWLPAFLPRTRPWLDLALVIEESPSMAVWQRTVHELALLLSHLGAFRDLRRWRLRTHPTDRTVTLHSAGNDAPRRHKELLDPARRRLILIVSDGASPAWYGTTLLEWLRDWGNSHPVGLLQMLPDQRLWARGALGRAARWAVSAPAAGLANSQLRRRPLSAPPPRTACDLLPAMAPLPMTILDPARIKTWARLVAGTNPAECVGFVLRPARPQDPERRSAPIDWEARLADFHATATPLARRLACLLAAAPLRLPVMRLIQHALLPESGQTHLAEFLLSGLLKRLTPAERDAATVTSQPTEDPELIDYDFGTPEIRRRLLHAGLVTDAVEVQLRIGDYVAGHLGGPRQFLAALHGGARGSEPAMPAGIEPFAQVTREVLAWLGIVGPTQQLDSVVGGPPVIGDGELVPTPREEATVGTERQGPIRILHLSDTHFRTSNTRGTNRRASRSTTPEIETFDCFLSHNSRDKPAVPALAAALRNRGVSVWLDEEQLRPSIPWQTLLESGIRDSRSIAVLVGADGRGPWEEAEMRAALSLAVEDGRPVIPVLLADAPSVPHLPLFLGDLAWVDLRASADSDDPSALDRLIWGITGTRSGGEFSREPSELKDQNVDPSAAWDADPVLRSLVAFIGDEVAGGLVPDLIAITGDIASSGTAAEYALAREWLDTQLWPRLTPPGAAPLPRDRLLLVPGNHDVDRGRVDAVARMVQNGLLTGQDQDQIATVLDSPDQRGTLLKRHAAYLEFYATWFGIPQPLPWWQRNIDIRGQRLHIAGLDSAWMAYGDTDRGRLLLGRYQVNQTALHPDGEGADWRLALLHHPWDYLAKFDQDEVPGLIRRHSDLVLRGHRHQGEAFQRVTPDPDDACIELDSGSVYAGSLHLNAFQWIELVPHARKVRVHLRRCVKQVWGIDESQKGYPGGTAEFDLIRTATPPSNIPQPQALEVPEKYKEWVRKTYGRLKMFGQDYEEARSVILSDVYVPAVTVPAVQSRTDPQSGEPVKAASTLLLHRIDQESLYCPGPPGAGKSTFCRWAVFRSIPGDAPKQPIKPPEGFEELTPKELQMRLPLLVLLREFWPHMDCGPGELMWSRAKLEKALVDWVDEFHHGGLAGANLSAHLNAGATFLVLDGLDEVPRSSTRTDGSEIYPRKLLISGLKNALPEWKRLGNRTLLTARPYGLNDAEISDVGLPRADLQPIPEELQKLFIKLWFHTLESERLGEELIESIKDQENMNPLLKNPILLTALCIVYFNGRRLHGDRFVLYQRIVKDMLFNRYPGEVAQRETIKATLEAIAYGMHTGDGLHEKRLNPELQASDQELETLLINFTENTPIYVRDRVDAAVWRDELLTRSGLLRPLPDGRAQFFHASFQEYLAAERMARMGGDCGSFEQDIRNRWAVRGWHDTLLFLISALVHFHDITWVWGLLSPLAESLTRAGVKANPAPAVLIAAALDYQYLSKKYKIPDQLTEKFRRICLDAIADEVEIDDRKILRNCLGRLDDPSIFPLRSPTAYVEVPPGDYVYGENNEKISIATPFLLARYPVTNGQYCAFMEDNGYATRKWWSDEGWAWKEQTGVCAPAYWKERGWNAPNQPVVGVSFWEAEACCHWAGGRLPTGQQWEAAARGPGGSDYPWCGDWEDGICNSAEAGLGVTSPVGIFPRSRQARLGIEDLTGNVWEWCDDFYDEPGAEPSRVLRGGAFDVEAGFLRSTDRKGYLPASRDRVIGFRCILDAPRQP